MGSHSHRVRAAQTVAVGLVPVRLQAFGRLSLAPYGADAGYPDRTLPFGMQIRAEGGQMTMVRGGICVVGPAG